MGLTQNPAAPTSRLCHVGSSRIMLQPRAALGPLAVVGNKPARAAEAGIDAFPWHGTTTWQSRKVRGMPFVVLHVVLLGLLRYISEIQMGRLAM